MAEQQYTEHVLSLGARPSVEVPLFAPTDSDTAVRMVNRTSDNVVAMARVAVGHYLSSCATTVGRELDVRIRRYLTILAEKVPLSCILVGQSPYDSEILPPVAAAFAFDIDRVRHYTPSVQVLSQYLSYATGLPEHDIASVLSVSYVLLEVGAAAINVHPANGLSVPQRVRVESHFAELLRSLLYLSASCGVPVVYVFCFGDVAKGAMQAAMHSMSAEDISPTAVVIGNLAHPAWVARTFEGTTTDIGEPVSGQCRWAHQAVRQAIEGDECTALDTCSRVVDRGWVRYSSWQLSYIGHPSTIGRVMKQLLNNNITLITAKFVESAQTASPRYWQEREMSGYQPGQARLRASTQHRPRNHGISEPDYMTCVLRDLYSKCTALCGNATSTLEAVKAKANLLPTEEANELRSLIDTADAMVGALVASASFFVALPGLLTSNTPAVALSGGSVPPLVRTIEGPPQVDPLVPQFADLQLAVQQVAEGTPSSAATARAPQAVAPGTTGGRLARRMRAAATMTSSNVATTGGNNSTVSESPLTAVVRGGAAITQVTEGSELFTAPDSNEGDQTETDDVRLANELDAFGFDIEDLIERRDTSSTRMAVGAFEGAPMQTSAPATVVTAVQTAAARPETAVVAPVAQPQQTAGPGRRAAARSRQASTASVSSAISNTTVASETGTSFVTPAASPTVTSPSSAVTPRVGLGRMTRRQMRAAVEQN